jgi:hypothetical protein
MSSALCILVDPHVVWRLLTVKKTRAQVHVTTYRLAVARLMKVLVTLAQGWSPCWLSMSVGYFQQLLSPNEVWNGSSDWSLQHHSLLFHAFPTVLDAVEAMHIRSSDEFMFRPTVDPSEHVANTSTAFEEVRHISFGCLRWYE